MKGREFGILSNKMIGCVIEVQKTLCPGLLKSKRHSFDLYKAGEHQARLPNQLQGKAIEARVKKLCFMNRHNITREVNAVISSSPSCSSW